MPATEPEPGAPTVAVLLATYNGRRWLPEQLQSILAQSGVLPTVHVLDDGSTDGTLEWLRETAAREPRLVVLESERPSGRAAANFFRLIQRADTSAAEFVALADQDDVWMPDKLASHVSVIRETGVDGVSSNITAFHENGARTLIRKSFPQREFDYLTESPGPGSTFLMTPRLVALVREVLASEPLASTAEYHDSLIYAVARARGLRWHIDPASSVDYRQHDHNVMGANVGGSSAMSRFRLVRSHWHRNQAIIHATVGLTVAPPELQTGLSRMLELMTIPGVSSRFALARAARNMRRRPRDRAVIGLLILLGIW